MAVKNGIVGIPVSSQMSASSHTIGYRKILMRSVALLAVVALVTSCASKKSVEPEPTTPVFAEELAPVITDAPNTPPSDSVRAEPAAAPPMTSPPVQTAEPVPSPDGPATKEMATATPVPAKKPVDSMAAPAPTTRPEPSVEVVKVTEEPANTTRTVEVIETDDEVVVRTETTTTTDRVVERVEVDPKTDRVTEDIAVVETTQRQTDTLVVEKATGAEVETVEVAHPQEKVLEAARIEMAPEKPRDPRRFFAGPEQFPPRDYGAYAIMAIRADAPASDRDRIRLICDAFVTSEAAEGEDGITPASSMVSVWPIASVKQADGLNAAISKSDICMEAVNHYGLALAHRAIMDTEKTGWILDNPGPYMLAWAPGSAKGEIDARVMVLDLTSVTTPEQAANIMQSWAELERDPSLRNESGWNTPAVQTRIGDWRLEHGRNLMLLGPVEG